jgi:hypothetical protein
MNGRMVIIEGRKITRDNIVDFIAEEAEKLDQLRAESESDDVVWVPVPEWLKKSLGIEDPA